MQDIIGYAENNLCSLKEQAFNPADSLLLSQLAYVSFDGIVTGIGDKGFSLSLRDMLKAELFESLFGKVRDPESNRRLLFALAASPRFRDTKIGFYINKADQKLEKQFSAVTYLLDDETAYIAYRGTDATILGWKEDFNMAFISPVPSQEEAAGYLSDVAKKLPRSVKLIVGGHSKGGNLAVYSAMKCEQRVQARIKGVYNHDGPGFKDSVFGSPEFMAIEKRINTTLPESSLIGMLLQHHENYSVVKSSRSGIMQHDPFSWIVDNNDFCYTENIKTSAMYRNRTLNQLVAGLDDEKRRFFVDVLFSLIETTGASTVKELTEDWRKNASAVLSAVKNIDAESKKIILQTVNELVKLSFKNLRGTTPKITTGTQKNIITDM